MLHKKAYPAISPSRPQLSTNGKRIAITGAGSGVGARTALAFAESGASHLALLGRTEKTLATTRAAVNQAYPETQVQIYTADITDAKAVNAALGSFASTVRGKIDVLVANAGYLASPEPLTGPNPEEWWYGFEANVKGQYNLVREFLQVAAADATVINVSSCVAHFPYVPGHSSYHLSKLAAIKLFDYVQAENPGLTTIHFHPGVIETSMSQKSYDAGIPKVEMDNGAFILATIASEDELTIVDSRSPCLIRCMVREFGGASFQGQIPLGELGRGRAQGQGGGS